MVLLIKEAKAKNPDIPKGMLELWDHKHNELIKDLSMARYLIDEYKKTY
jgi:hypothetical protein